MILGKKTELGIVVYHDVRASFGDMLRMSLKGERCVAALGPIYPKDPGEHVIAPFVRSAIETGYTSLPEEKLVPDHTLELLHEIRQHSCSGPFMLWKDEEWNDAVNWSRAGLVLEIARRRGVHFSGRGVIHFNWKMRGTVTGRFGCETYHGSNWTLNPLTLSEDDRRRCRPSDAVRHVAVLDFKAMDVCSMAAIIPEFGAIIGDHTDPYTKIADVIGRNWSRDDVKRNFLVWAYGGVVDPDVLGEFWYHMRPVHDFTCKLPHGEFPRMVQTVSAQAFRAGLSRALPLLVTDHYIPMFTVHDELTLDVSEVGLDRIKDVQIALESGASEAIGRAYRVGVSTGYTYEEAKNG